LAIPWRGNKSPVWWPIAAVFSPFEKRLYGPGCTQGTSWFSTCGLLMSVPGAAQWQGRTQ